MDLTDRSLTSSSCLTVLLRFLVFGRKKKFMQLRELVTNLTHLNLTTGLGIVDNTYFELQVTNESGEPITEVDPIRINELNRMYVNYSALAKTRESNQHDNHRAKQFLNIISEYLQTPLADRAINDYWIARLIPTEGHLPGDVCKILDITFSHQGMLPEWKIHPLTFRNTGDVVFCHVMTDKQLSRCQMQLPETMTVSSLIDDNIVHQVKCDVTYDRVGDFLGNN